MDEIFFEKIRQDIWKSMIHQPENFVCDESITIKKVSEDVKLKFTKEGLRKRVSNTIATCE